MMRDYTLNQHMGGTMPVMALTCMVFQACLVATGITMETFNTSTDMACGGPLPKVMSAVPGIDISAITTQKLTETTATTKYSVLASGASEIIDTW